MFEALKHVEEAAYLLLVTAQKRVPGKRWTLTVIYWDDNTFQVEYRHADDEGIHRFFYTPHKHPYRIKYYLYTSDEMLNSKEYTDFEKHCVKLREDINIVTETELYVPSKEKMEIPG